MAAAKKQQARVFKSQQNIMHDLYKLEVASAIKNVAWQPNVFSPERVEHCHFFHSVDKNGAPQKQCAQINGHFHELTLVTPGTESTPPIYKCGPALRWALVNINGQMVKKAVPADHNDTHTHEMRYIASEEFKPAKLNSEAMKLIAQVEKAPEPVPGIIG